MPTKYYRAENAARREIGGVLFELVDNIAGTILGVYATDIEDEQTKLDAACAVPTNAVKEIPLVQYEGYVKKKLPGLGTSNALAPRPVSAPNQAAVVPQVEAPKLETPSVDPAVVVASPDEFKVGAVDAPTPPPEPPKRSGRGRKAEPTPDPEPHE